MHHLGHARSGRRITAALNADRAVGDDHPHTRQVSFMNAVEQVFPRGLLRHIEEDDVYQLRQQQGGTKTK